MSENYTKGIQKILKYAKEEAIRLGQTFVGSEHLLLSIIKENSGMNEGCYPGSKKRITEIPISDSITLAVGPVGDFSEKEIKQLEKVGFIPVSIGERILRAETAVISSFSCLRTMAGEF